jgi:hypothetical protein
MPLLLHGARNHAIGISRASDPTAPDGAIPVHANRLCNRAVVPRTPVRRVVGP